MARDRIRACVISGKSKFWRAKARQHHQKVTRRSIKIGLPVVGIYRELRSCRWHQLPEPYGPSRAARRWTISTFDFNVGLEQRLPLRDGKSGPAQRSVSPVALCCALKCCEDVRAGYCPTLV